jgi:hypothetical protein
MFVPDGWDPDDAVFISGAEMAKIAIDGRIEQGVAGTDGLALCKSGKQVELYFAKRGETFDVLAKRWTMDPKRLLHINRVDSVINFRSLDSDLVASGRYPVVPTRHPIIKRLFEKAKEAKKVEHYSDATKDKDTYTTPAARKQAQVDAIEYYSECYGVVQTGLPFVSEWVTARFGGKEDFAIGVIEAIHSDTTGAPCAFDILYDIDTPPVLDVDSADGTMIQNVDHETNVPLDRVVFIQKLSKKRKRNEADEEEKASE